MDTQSTAINGGPGRRQRDRRSAFLGFLSTLMPIVQRHGHRDVQGALERAVLHLLPAEAVSLVEGESGVRRPPTAGGASRSSAASVVVPIPVADEAPAAHLEVRFHGARAAEPWSSQQLEIVGHVAALIVAVKREREQASHFGRHDIAAPRDGAAPLIGSSGIMQALRARIERVAATDFTVLIEGESGVGKELVARQIHELSRRRPGPFVAVNCAALVETLLEAELFGIEDRTATGVRGRQGKFEHADGGTLFLDEVSDLSVSAQAKLLRAIQDLAVERVGGRGHRRVDVRIVAATNRSLSDLVDRGLFRHDLFYRLSGVDVCVPPLRLRREDITELAGYFLARHRITRRLVLSAPAADALVAYDWPGNVRELQRVIEGVVVLADADRVELDDLPPGIRGGYAEILLPSLARGDTMRAWGSRYARLVLERSGGNKRAACDRLGISYHTLQAYLRYRPRRSSGSASTWSGPPADVIDADDHEQDDRAVEGDSRAGPAEASANDDDGSEAAVRTG
jgi:DNA-binding NtrC family response regulator